jgi:7-cyano-7-deazaguanine synthase
MIDPQPKAVVLMSGGMDSAVCASMAQSDGYKIAALHVNYGQRTESREEKAFSDLCEFFRINQKLVVNIDYLRQIGGSSLTDSNIEVGKANLDSKDIPATYVPFRNANLLSIAVSWAEVIGAGAIYIGAMQLDSSGYPDCRRNFFDAFEQTANLGTKPETHIKIITPIIDMTKKEIVETGMQLGTPFYLTWSCYKSEGKACGVCDSCALRLRGFRQAGAKDPIEYE